MNEWNRYRWEAAGPSGGGQTIGAAISPHDPELIFVASDMGGIYRSQDGGKSFALLDGRTASRMCCDFNLSAIAFHPKDPKTVYLGVWNGLLISRDGGRTFRYGKNGGMPYGPSRILLREREAPQREPEKKEGGECQLEGLLAYNDLETGESRIQDLDGETIFQMPDLVFGLAWYGQRIFVCGSRTQYISADGGRAFHKLGERAVKGFFQAGGYVYFTEEHGLYRLELGGAFPWEEASKEGAAACLPEASKEGSVACLYETSLEEPVACLYETSQGRLSHVAAVGEILYLGYEGDPRHFDGENISTILRSRDGGRTFAPVLFGHPAHGGCNQEESWISGKWGWHLPPSCLAVTPADPRMLLYTNFTGMGISRDEGASFREAGASQGAQGIQVMTSWKYVIDPHEPGHHYIAMTDFSGWHSRDGGVSWDLDWLGNPWKSNIYCIAPHPRIPGRLLAGTGNVHDLPYWHWLRRQDDSWAGGIIQSDDYGRTWYPQDRSGMGPFGIVTDLCYFKDQVFAAVLGQGLYVSDETENYWRLLDRTLPRRNTARLFAAEDRLLVTVWPEPRAGGAEAGAVYETRDGRQFTEIPLGREMKYPVHALPVSKGELYVSCFDCIDNYVKGRISFRQDEKIFGKPGLYYTADQGRSWERIYEGAVYSATELRGRIWFCTREEGLWLLDGKTPRREAHLPVINPHTVTSGADQTLYVTSFGQGVYRGRPKENDKEER